MKKQLLTLSSILASVSLATAQTGGHSHSNNSFDSDRSTSQITINSDEIAEAQKEYEKDEYMRNGVDTGYGRNDRNVADDLSRSTYQNRNTVSQSISQEIERDEKFERDWHQHQKQVDQWRNQVRGDLDAMNRASESEYESARDRLHKSYSSYYKAKVRAGGFISHPNTRARTPHK